MKLFFRELGKGKPIVILHGLFGMSDNWISFARRLADNYRVILPDLRNHGQSPRSHSMNYNAMAGDVFELLDGLNLKECFLVGHSMGGKVAMTLALEMPHLVSSLTVLDISPKKYFGRKEHDLVLKIMRETDFSLFDSRSALEQHFKHQLNDNKLIQLLLKNIYRVNPSAYGWRLHVEAIWENLDDIFDWPVNENTYVAKTLFIKGSESEYISSDDSSIIHYYFPRAEIKILHGAGHWLQVDQPETLLKIISDYLKE